MTGRRQHWISSEPDSIDVATIRRLLRGIGWDRSAGLIDQLAAVARSNEAEMRTAAERIRKLQDRVRELAPPQPVVDGMRYTGD